ncbi:MAG: hypothetical protein ACK5HY_05690 [Parahaliea sp.]
MTEPPPAFDNITDIAELLPHERPMMLLERLLDAGHSHLCCEVIVRQDGLFDDGESVPAYLGLEYMAQTVAAFSGLCARRRGEPVKLGFLLGTRNFSTNRSRLPCLQRLRVSARQLLQASSGMASFDCAVEGESVSQSARISVYEPEDPARYLASGEAA